MAGVLRSRLVLLAALLVFCDTAKCYDGRSGSQLLISSKLLSAGKLEMVWQNQLPMKENESLERLYVRGNRIYGLSDKNYIVSLNRENGDLMFRRTFTRVGFAVLGFELYDDEIISVIGREFIEVDAKIGRQNSVKLVEYGITCPVVRNSSHYYVAGTDNRLHALRAEDKVQVFEVAAESDSVITSIIADERFVIFGTEAGDCVIITADRPQKLGQFNAADGIVWPMVRDRSRLFVASKDTNVYGINLMTGKLDWKYKADSVLERGPVVTWDVVYQYVHGKGLTAINKVSGKELWRVDKGAGLLAEANGKAYVITSVETLVVMDNVSAEQLCSINLRGVSKYATNVTDSRIYIASEDGRVACLKPVE